MASHYRHRRTSTAGTPFPTPVEPGEIVANTANRQLVIGDAASATLGQPLALLAVRFFDARAQYAVGDYVVQAGGLYRANTAIVPGAFNATQWDALTAADVTKAYVDAGDAAVTTAFQNADASLAASMQTGFDQTTVAMNGKVAKAGDTMTGALNLSGLPTVNAHAANKQYVDQQDALNVSKTYVDNADALKVAKAGDTMTGTLTVAPASADPVIALKKPASGNGAYIVGYKGALARWSIIPGGQNAESGSDTGSDFYINAFDDAGNLKSIPITISRATGVVTFLPASLATAAEYISNSAPTKMLTPGAVWSAAAPVNPGAVGGFQPDFNSGFDFAWTLISVTSTLYNPLNPKPGQKGIIYLTQDATGNRKITTWGTQYFFPGGVKPTLSTVPQMTDTISYVVYSPSVILCNFAAGYA